MQLLAGACGQRAFQPQALLSKQLQRKTLTHDDNLNRQMITKAQVMLLSFPQAQPLPCVIINTNLPQAARSTPPGPRAHQ
jgi:hypothetical protein